MELAETAQQIPPSKMENACVKTIGLGMTENSGVMKSLLLALLDPNGTKTDYNVSALTMENILLITNANLAKKTKGGMALNVSARAASIKSTDGAGLAISTPLSTVVTASATMDSMETLTNATNATLHAENAMVQGLINACHAQM